MKLNEGDIRALAYRIQQCLIRFGFRLAEHFLRDGEPKPKPEQMENAIWALAKEIQDAVEDFTDPDLPHGICEFMK